MSDTAKGLVKFAAITAAVFYTGGAAAGALGWAKMGWTTALAISTVVASAIKAHGLKSRLDNLNDGISAQQAGIQYNPTGTDVTVPIIYGTAKVGMSIVDTRLGDDANVLVLVGAIAIAPEAGSGIQAVTNVYFNEDKALDGPIFGDNNSSNNPTPFDSDKVESPWNGNVTSGTFGTDFWLEYFIHDGDDDQVVDYALNDEGGDAFGGAWGTDAEGVGVAYIVLWLYFNEEIYTNGVPNVTMEVQGNKIKNVQDLVAAARYSENPADCIYDFMTSKRYGMGIPVAQINTASFSTAAAYCDEDDVTITITGGDDVTLPARYTCNGFLMPDDGPLANLERLLSSCSGRLVMEGGQYHLLIRQTQSAETFELNRTNIVGEWSFLRTGVNETPNTLVATYIDKELNYQPQIAMWPEAGVTNSYLALDNDYGVEARLELPFTENYYMAEMIASQQLLERRADMGCALVAQREALKLGVGDVVNVNHDTPSWTDQKMWVEAIGLRRDGLVQLALKEYDPAVYTVPTMTVKLALIDSVLPSRYAGTGVTVEVLNAFLYAMPQGSDIWFLDMALSFTGGMGSYNVHHAPDSGSAYNYTTNFTGTSTTVTLYNAATGTTPFPFDASEPPTGISTITFTPYPDAAAGGIAGAALTLTFEIAGPE
jgi:hypothetical protein